MRAGPRGILVTLADGIKLFFKEGITPTNADRPVYVIAPVLAIVPAFLAFSVIPFGIPVTLFGRTVPFQVANLDIGILWILAMTSIGVYSVVFAGWSSGSNYPLLGSIRSTAQMVSYEVAMGLALVAVILYSGHLNLNAIIAQQDKVWNVDPAVPGVRRLPDLRLGRDESSAVRPRGGRDRAGRRASTRSIRGSSSPCSTWAST